jgi:hypothetical protein
MKRIIILLLPVILLAACNQQSNISGNIPDTSAAAISVNDTSSSLNIAAGPDTAVKITEEYARMVAKNAYFWAWPMVNIYNKRLAFSQAKEPGLTNGILPAAPLNRLAMLSDYVAPEERQVACPNQDVVYGGGMMALDQSAVVIQVPDFGKRFWVYQLANLRTDAFAQLGAMYGTKPGFYLVVGPGWKGEIPKGINKVFYSKTNTVFVAPRVFKSDDPADLPEVRKAIQEIKMYPLNEFDGKMKLKDWAPLAAEAAKK